MKQKEIRAILHSACEAIEYSVLGTEIDCKTRRRLSELHLYYENLLKKERL